MESDYKFKQSFKMKSTLLLFLIITVSIAFPINLKQPAKESFINEDGKVHFPFERTIWTYWNSPNGSIPLIVQICFDNIKKVAKKYNFNFICVNESTVRNYIENYDEEFIQVRKKSVQNTPAHAADLLRILLIEQQGGIWVDSTTIFLNGLDQLENIMSEKYSYLVANRFSPQPDVLLFYYSQGQNRIQHWVEDPRNSSRKILYNPYPDYQIWMIAAKKNAKLIQDVRKTYQQWTTLDFNVVSKLLIDQDIYMHRIDNFGNYLYLNMVVSYVQQRKQLQLDQKTSLTGPRITAFQYYNLWGLHSQYGPMLTTREDISPIQDLLEYSKQELQDQKNMKYLFFMKQFGYFRYVMGYKLDILIQIYEKRNQTFEQFFATKPSGQWCQNITWLVQGSIMDQMIKNSHVSQKHKFPTITKSQNSQWKQYCQQNGSLFSYAKHLYSSLHIETLIISVFMHDKIHKAKVNSILTYNKNLDFSEWLKVKFDDNSFLIMDFVYLLIILLIIWISYRKMLQLSEKHVKKVCETTTIERNVIHMDGTNQIDAISAKHQMKPTRKASRPFNAFETHWLSQKQKYSFLTFGILLSTLTLYNAVDVLGGLDQPETFFIFLLFIFMVESFMECKFLEGGKRLIKSQQEYELFYIIINYMLSYMALCNVRKNRFWLNWFSMVLGMVGPCILKLKNEINLFEANDQIRKIKKNKQPFWSFKFNKFRYITIFLLLVPLVLPKIPFMAGANRYYVEKIPTVLTIFLGLILVYVLIKCLEHKFYQEVCRLLILVGICCVEPTYIDRMDFMVHNHSRILHIFRYVVVIGVIYQMMGSEFKFRQMEDVYFKKSWKTKLITYFGLIGLEIFPGRLLYSVDYILWTKWEFIEHLAIIMYGVYLMALFSQFEKIRKGKIEETIQYTEVEMDNLSED